MSSSYDSVKKAIDIYDTSVKDALKILKKQLALSAGWTGGSATIAIVGTVTSNWFPVITALGFSGITAKKYGKQTVNIFSNYLKHSQYLTTSVNSLKASLEISQISNPPNYDKVIEKFDSYMTNLTDSKYPK